MTEKELLAKILNENIRIGGSWILYEKGIIPYEDVDDIDLYIRSDKGDLIKFGSAKMITELGYRLHDYRFGNHMQNTKYPETKIIHLHFMNAEPPEIWNKLDDVSYILKRKLIRIRDNLYSQEEIENGAKERDIRHCDAISKRSKYK